MNDTRDQARQQWQRVVADARTPEEHACVATARRLVPVDDGHLSWHPLALAIYTDMKNLGAHAALNDTPATCAQAVDLDMIKQARDGLDAAMINTQTRSLFLRRRWVVAFDRTGKPAGPREWACKLHITETGAAVAAATLSQPIDLTDAQAAPLREIVRCPNGRDGSWPGNAWTYRVASRYELIVERRPFPAAQPNWFTLTEAGKQALARHKAKRRKPATPTLTQAQLLEELANGNTRTRTGMYPTGTYDVCEAHEWVRYGEKDKHGRRPLFITAAGREAIARYHAGPARPTGKSKHERRPARELAAGMQVRLANRAGYRNLGPDWITVHRIDHAPRVGRRPGGYWVVYLRDGREHMYCSRAFNQLTRFEVKTATTPATPPAIPPATPPEPPAA